MTGDGEGDKKIRIWNKFINSILFLFTDLFVFSFFFMFGFLFSNWWWRTKTAASGNIRVWGGGTLWFK